MDESKRKILFKKVIFIASVVVVLGILGVLTYFFINFFTEMSDAESFKDFVLSFGAKGFFVGFGCQILQVFVALIPGEIIEIGLGYAFGAIFGTLICFAGLAIAGSAVFLLVKKLGLKFFDLFYSREKFESLRFVRRVAGNKKRLNRLAFIIYLVPGTPKDLFTYFLGLTPMTLSEFLIVSMLGRIPSVISSTVGGMLIHNGHYAGAVILFVVTALLSVTGWLWYDKYTKEK